MKKAGRKHTSSLFKEFGNANSPYSLELFKSEFIAFGENSGYLCSQRVITEFPEKDRWDEWKRIFFNAKLHRILEGWRKDLEIRVRAEAESKLAKGCDPKDFPRLRFLISGGLSSGAGAGRPSKGQQGKTERIKAKVEIKDKPSSQKADKIIEMATWRKTENSTTKAI